MDMGEDHVMSQMGIISPRGKYACVRVYFFWGKLSPERGKLSPKTKEVGEIIPKTMKNIPVEQGVSYGSTLQKTCGGFNLCNYCLQNVHVKSVYAYDPNLFDLFKLEPDILAVSFIISF